jgi:hypothetical protein
MKIETNVHEKNNIIESVLFFFVLIVLGLVFLNSPGTSDVTVFTKVWVSKIQDYGFISGYINNANLYPPLSFIMMGIIAKTALALSVDILLLFKILLFLFYISSSIIFFALTGDKKITIMLHLSLLLNSMALGYIDILYIAFLIPSVIALYHKKYLAFTLLFAVSCSMKFQPLIIAPFLLISVIDVQRVKDLFSYDYRDFMKNIFMPAFIIVLVFLVIYGISPFVNLKRGMKDGFISGTALNLSWIYTFFLHVFNPEKFGALNGGIIDCITTNKFVYRFFPRLLYSVVSIFLLYRLFEKPRFFKRTLIFSIMGYMTYSILNTGVHENHIILICPLFAILAYLDSKYIIDCALWMLFSNINLLLFYGITGSGFAVSRIVFGIDISLIVSIVIVFWYAYFIIREIKNDNGYIQTE